MTERQLSILGTRGIPASHGGFETFAEHLALYLVERGWRVSVYCQEPLPKLGEDYWRGIHRIFRGSRLGGPVGTILFDMKSILNAAGQSGICLSLGYGTAIFFPLLKLRGRVNLVNMDGMEWQRSQWPWYARTWLRCNERMAIRLANHLIADHPRIADYLATLTARNHIAMIPYGADRLEGIDPAPLDDLGLAPGGYALVIARPEPDNSILEIVRAFSARKRNLRLVVLGSFYGDRNRYHRDVIDTASDEVLFPGAIYAKEKVQALRYHARFYIHGHQVGGTNPSLVEALGAGNAVLAHDNPFNRWVAGTAAQYFNDEASCEELLTKFTSLDDVLKELRERAWQEFERFTWGRVLADYERLLQEWWEHAHSG